YIGVNDEEQEHILHLIDKGKVDDALYSIRADSKILEYIRLILNYNDVDINNVANVYNEVEGIKIPGLQEEFDRLKDLASIMNKMNVNYTINLGFVRGLAYYTGIIFEVEKPNLPFSIAGGGRYDSLVELYGGPYTPAIGFAIGIERTLAALTDKNIKSDINKIVIIFLDRDVIPYGLNIVEELRENNFYVTINTKDISLTKLIPFYAEQGYKYLLIIGKKEQENGSVTIKDLGGKAQQVIERRELINFLKLTLS
ncbi:ATP phosphoribosyltransferase regulatory subunit, partial [Acidianus sp. RZ1]